DRPAAHSRQPAPPQPAARGRDSAAAGSNGRGGLIVRKTIAAAIPFLVVTAALEWLVRAGWIRAFLAPPPRAVFETIWRDWPELSAALARTSAAVLAGFALSALGGIAIAVFLSSSRAIQEAFYPYAVFFQTVPIIAIAPLLVIWFGYGMRTVV